MSQERRALHEKHRKRRHADIGHDVTAVFPAPLVRQTRTGRPQPRYKVLDRSHTTLESDSLQPAHCRIAPRFNLSHSPLNVALSAKMRIAAFEVRHIAFHTKLEQEPRGTQSHLFLDV